MGVAQELDAPMIPIITIYILGFPLEHLEGHSAVMIKRHYCDAVTGEASHESSVHLSCARLGIALTMTV